MEAEATGAARHRAPHWEACKLCLPTIESFVVEPHGGRRASHRRLLIDGLIGVTFIFVFALATFTNTELGDSFTAELQCEVINDFSNDLCIQAGTTVYVGTENEVAIITLIWLAWVLISTMILPGITGWSRESSSPAFGS